jgi:hypothetical protein
VSCMLFNKYQLPLAETTMRVGSRMKFRIENGSLLDLYSLEGT